MTTTGYVQQLALRSLRSWVSREIEGIKRPEIQKIERPEAFCQNKGDPIAVLSVWETLIEAQKNVEFVKFIEGNGYSKDQIQGFIEGWERFECGRVESWQRDFNGNAFKDQIIKGREIWLPSVLREYSNGSKGLSLAEHNPYLSFFKTKSAVSRTMRRLESLELETVYDIVLTLPKEVNDLAYDQGEYVKRKISDLTKEFYEWLGSKIFNARIAVNANIHMWSSENPLKSHAHVHTLLLGEYVKLEKGQKLEDGKIEKILPSWFMSKNVRTNRYEEGALTKLIKKKWAYFVNKKFNTNYEALDVHIDFIELCDRYGLEIVQGHRRLLHKLKYNRRRPVSDLALYFTDNKFMIKGNNPLWAEFLVEYENRPITLGFWNRMSKIAKKPIEDVKPNEARCPFCSRPLLYVGFYPKRELPKDVKKVFVDRSNNFYQIINEVIT